MRRGNLIKKTGCCEKDQEGRLGAARKIKNENWVRQERWINKTAVMTYIKSQEEKKRKIEYNLHNEKNEKHKHTRKQNMTLRRRK